VAAFAAAFYQMMREPAHAEALAAEAVALGETRGFALWVGFGGVLRAWARAVLGTDAGSAAAAIGGALERLTKIGMVVGQSYFLALLAEAQVLAGDEAAALASLDSALAAAESSGIRYWQPELLRLRAERFQERDPAQALAGLERALEVARAQGARGVELRIATSASRLLRRLGRDEDARALLVPLYRQLASEGETRDLLEARGLVESPTRSR
jgi:predicted ATPase